MAVLARSIFGTRRTEADSPAHSISQPPASPSCGIRATTAARKQTSGAPYAPVRAAAPSPVGRSKTPSAPLRASRTALQKLVNDLVVFFIFHASITALTNVLRSLNSRLADS